jgi:hypothetical protein
MNSEVTLQFSQVQTETAMVRTRFFFLFFEYVLFFIRVSFKTVVLIKKSKKKKKQVRKKRGVIRRFVGEN